jgi:hypothetical protein
MPPKICKNKKERKTTSRAKTSRIDNFNNKISNINDDEIKYDPNVSTLPWLYKILNMFNIMI